MYGKRPVWVSVILVFYMPSSPCRLISWRLINVDAAKVAICTGFTIGLSLILAIGAQNAFVLRQGLRNEYVLLVVLVSVRYPMLHSSSSVPAVSGKSLCKCRGSTRSCDTGSCVSHLVRRQEPLLRRAFQCEHSCCQRTQNASAVLSTVLATCLALTWRTPCLFRYSGTYRNDFHAVSKGKKFCSPAVLQQHPWCSFFVGLWCKVSTTSLCNA